MLFLNHKIIPGVILYIFLRFHKEGLGRRKMGCLGNSKTEDQRIDEKAQREANKKIEKQLQKERQAYKATHRLLLLGKRAAFRCAYFYNKPLCFFSFFVFFFAEHVARLTALAIICHGGGYRWKRSKAPQKKEKNPTIGFVWKNIFLVFIFSRPPTGDGVIIIIIAGFIYVFIYLFGNDIIMCFVWSHFFRRCRRVRKEHHCEADENPTRQRIQRRVSVIQYPSYYNTDIYVSIYMYVCVCGVFIRQQCC